MNRESQETVDTIARVEGDVQEQVAAFEQECARRLQEHREKLEDEFQDQCRRILETNRRKLDEAGQAIKARLQDQAERDFDALKREVSGNAAFRHAIMEKILRGIAAI